MAEIDSLEIKLQSNIQAVTKDLEQLIGKITLTSKAIASFGNNKALEQLNREAKGVADGMKQAASASGAMKNVSSAASAAQKPMEQLRKSVDETAKDLYAKFENFTPVINFSQSEESLKKLSETYQDQMVKAQNELNRIMASSSASSQTKGMERYIIRIQEAKNGIKAINDYLDRMSNKPATGEPVIHGAADMEDEKRSLKSFEEEYRNFEAMFKAGGVETEGGTFLPTRSVEMGLEQLREMYPQAKSLIASYEDLFNRLTKMESGVKFGGALAEIPEQLKIADNPQDAFQPLTEEVNEFQKVLDSIKPIEFKGNFFEMERWVDGLNQRFVSLQSRIEKLNQLGVNPDTQRLHTLQYDLQTVSVTLDKYKNELDEARKAGQLDIKIPSIDSQINRVQGSFNKLQNTMRGAKVVIPTDSLKKVDTEIERVKKKYDQTVESINRKAQTVQFYGTSTDYKNKMIELEALRNKYQELINKQSQLSKIGGGGYEFNTKSIDNGIKSLQKLHKNLEIVHRPLQKVNNLINSFGKKFASLVSPIKKASSATNGFSNSLSLSFKTILKYAFGIRSLFVLFNRLRAAITEGMMNLVQYSAATNQSLSMLKSSLNQTKNSLAAAFSPILNAIAPAVNYLIQLLIKAINVINQFFAAITGKSTWIRAKYVYQDIAASMKDTGKGASDTADEITDKTEEMAKAVKGALQPFDALNNLTSDKNDDLSDKLKDAMDDLGGGGILPEDMFETLPVDSKIKEFADKVKDILKRLFAPIKKAWDREGKFVMDSWEKALKNVWALIKDIGRDFLRVWEQDATVDVLANILHIIGDIGLVVSNLAERFREAWNENEVGFHIFEKIRDIIGIIIQHIRNAADATVEWSAKLDFYPLLDAFDRFLESIKPVVDAVYGVMEDFYTQVLLPLGKWTLEKGLPELLQVFIDFNNKVDWEGLRQSLSELWDHLEPFAETVGEGLILFIERVSDAIANFINSDKFDSFLEKFEDWLDNVEPEDVADAIENLVKAFIALKVAVFALKGASGIIDTISKIGNLALLFGGGSAAGAGAGAVEGVGTAASASLGPVLAIVAAITALVAGLGYVYSTNEEVRASFDNAISSIRDGLQPVVQFFTETLLPGLRSGWERVMEILTPLGQFLQGAFTSIWQDMINPALTYIGQTVLPLVANAFSNFWNNVLVPLGNFISSVLSPAIQILSDILTMLWNNVIVPLADFIGTVFRPAFEGLVEVSNTMNERFSAVMEVLLTLWNNVLSPLVDYVWGTLKPIFEDTFNAIGDVINGLADVLGGLIKFITGVFTGDWSKAWEGIKDIFKGVFNSIVGILEGATNLMVDGINSLISGFNSVAGSIGGKVGINVKIPSLPKISLPKLEAGGIALKHMFAEIGEYNKKEAILPLENQSAMRMVANSIMEQVNATPSSGYNSETIFANNNAETNALLRELISAVRESGNIEWDGSIIGEKMRDYDSQYYNRTGRGAFQH